MPKMYNPDTQEIEDVKGGQAKKALKDSGFLNVGNRPEAEYVGKTREEIRAEDDDEEVETPPEAPPA